MPIVGTVQVSSGATRPEKTYELFWSNDLQVDISGRWYKVLRSPVLAAGVPWTAELFCQPKRPRHPQGSFRLLNPFQSDEAQTHPLQKA
jgi:hypothetical protein